MGLLVGRRDEGEDAPDLRAACHFNGRRRGAQCRRDAGPKPSPIGDLTDRRADPIISGPCLILMHRVREGDGLTPRTGSFSKVLLAVLVLAAAGGPPVRAAQ